MNEINLLARRLGVTTSVLKQALTHYSFYNDKDHPNANTRYIFAGMFVFKGLLAQEMLKYISANGSQLQHQLGNMTNNEKLANIFNNLKLKNMVRAGENFDINSNKHLFAYGLLGCISQHCNDEKIIQRFIHKHFLTNKDSIFFHTTKNHDYKGQADKLAKQFFGEGLVLETNYNSGIYITTIALKNDQPFVTSQSKSYQYSRKKALKQAIILLSDKMMQTYYQSNTYYRTILLRIAKEQEAKHEERAAKEKQKQLRKQELEEKRKKINAAKDAARRKAQAEAKERKKKKAEIIAIKQAKEQKPLSSKKRRHLEDKAK